MNKLTFRSSRITYYGPHPCQNCGAVVVTMGLHFGGNAFDQPAGPIYPNTEWHPHVCNTGNGRCDTLLPDNTLCDQVAPCTDHRDLPPEALPLPDCPAQNLTHTKQGK